MERIICIGDLHGTQDWKLILHTEKWDRAVLIGDYFDSFEFNAMEQLKNFDEICAYKRASKKPVIMLIGNHDYENYMPWGTGCSGKQENAYVNICLALKDNMDLLQMAYFEENVLFSHAGVGESWLEKHTNGLTEGFNLTAENVANRVNDIWRWKPTSFAFDGRDGYGDDMGQTPIWIRPKSLMKDSQQMKKEKIIQVAGHTKQRKIDIEGKSTGVKYFFIDTLGTSGEYLILEKERENIEFKIGKI